MSDSNINVAVKMRPLIKREIDKKIPACWKKCDSILVDTITGTNEFSFDLIFDENSSTNALYDKVARPIVSTALAGVNGTVFAYGQTSSGKTHTMMGDENNDGLMLMAIKHIFNEVQSSNIEFVIRVGFIEIYNEKVYDLYDPDNVDLKMVEKNNDAYVNCKEAICKCVDDMYNVIKIGNKNKKIGDTDMNDRSSRSHTIFRISIESIDAVSEKAKISNLNLVDLAGSERASQTGATGTRFVEGAHINKSLLSLSKVINKLINNENCHINYRDSKLTRYLQSSLGGNAMAAIICTICPTALDETISTLYFAQRAMKVTNKPRVNEIISDATMIKQLHNQIKTLKVELKKAKSEANSTVPRILQELSLHQGNILNYKKAENKSKLRRRTWNTFDNELAVISETTPLVLTTQQTSMTDLSSLDSVAPILLHKVTRDRGIGAMDMDYDAAPDFEELPDEFGYKAKYLKLLLEFEELQEFTNWENKLNIEPDAEADYRTRIGGLGEEIDGLQKERLQLRRELEKAQQEKGSTEYLYEQHLKKAEQREKDLLGMFEELKNGEMARNAVEEKNRMIQELQEQIQELSTANDALLKKVEENGDVEKRVQQLEKVEVELGELRNTITALTNTVLTLENEKKEMSVRFNESMSASTFEASQTVCPVPTAASTASVIVSANTEELIVSMAASGEVGKLQAENDELSSKVMDLIEENDDLKQRVEDLLGKVGELEALAEELRVSCAEEKAALDTVKAERVAIEERLADNATLMEALSGEKNRLSDNCETQSEEVAMARSEKEWLERQMKLAEEKIQELEGQLKEGNEKVVELKEEWTGQLAEQQRDFDEKMVVMDQKLKQAGDALRVKEGEIEDKLAEQSKLFDESTVSLESRIESLLLEIKTNELLLSQQAAEFEEQRLRLEGEMNVLKKELQQSLDRMEETKQQLKVVSESAGDAGQLQLERDRLHSELEVQKQNVHLLNQEKSTLKMTIQELEYLVQEKEEVVASVEQLQRELSARTLRIGELQDLLDNATSFEQEINAAKEAKEALQSELDDLHSAKQREENDLRMQLESTERQLNAATEAKASLQSNLEEQLNAVQLEKKELQSQLHSLKDSLTDKEDELKQLQEEISHFSSDHQLRVSMDGELKERLIQAENRASHLQEEMGKRDEQIGEYMQRMRELESVIEANSIDLTEAKKELDMLTARNGDLENAISESGATKSGLLEALQAEKADLMVQVAELAAQKEVASSQFEQVTNQLREMEDQKQELVMASQVAEGEKEEAKRELAEQNHRIVTLELMLESASTYERELHAASEAKRALQVELEGQLERLHATQKEKGELRCQLESVHDSLAEKENELRRLQAEMADFSRDHRQRDSMDDQLNERLVHLEHQLAVTQEEIRRRDDRIGEFVEQMRELESAVDTKTGDLSEARKELAVVSSKNLALEKAVADAGSQKEEQLERLQDEAEKLKLQIAALNADQSIAAARFEQVGKQLRDAEEQKQALATKLMSADGEREQLRRSLEVMASKKAALEEKFRDQQSKSEVVKTRVEQLEREVKQSEQQLVEAQSSFHGQTQKLLQDLQVAKGHEEEVGKLQTHIKKLRGELSEAQTKKEPRKMRRSSTFDTNRHLIGSAMTVDTQTDPVSELCQCEALNERVLQLQQNNMVKDLQIKELREAEKRSPLLLENYTLKKRFMAMKEAEAKHAKEMQTMEQRLYQAVKQAKQCNVCDNRKGFAVACQTMPDLNLEKISDMKRELTLNAGKYEEKKRVIVLQQDRITELQKELAKRERGAENNPNQLNTQPQPECSNLRQKYELVKSVVEKRYYRIVQMEKDMEALRLQRTCTVCKGRLNTLQVP